MDALKKIQLKIIAGSLLWIALSFGSFLLSLLVAESFGPFLTVFCYVLTGVLTFGGCAVLNVHSKRFFRAHRNKHEQS